VRRPPHLNRTRRLTEIKLALPTVGCVNYRRAATVSLVVMTLLAGSATAATATDEIAPADAALIVGLRAGVDPSLPAERIEAATDVDVVSAQRVGGLPAVAVDVPAGEIAEATAALRSDPAVRYVEPNRRRKATAVTANDPRRAQQWGLDRATAPGAWQRTTGSAGVTIAVVDSGVSVVPDLAGAVLPGVDYVDNDGNAADELGHGTAVAAIAAGRGNDAAGMAGACWSCKVLPVRVLDRWGMGFDGDIAAGIYYAANQGADVINLSLGGPGDSLAMRDAIAYAIGKGALVVAAAGNEGTSVRSYPAAVDGVLAVGASDPADARYWWSNYGPAWVDVAAPGCGPAPDQYNLFDTFCGTSGAAPLVAGIAGLALAADPAATAGDVTAAITATADPAASAWTAYGRVDALAAVQALTPASYASPPTVAATGPAANAVVRGTVSVSGTAADDSAVTKVELLANGSPVGEDAAAPYDLDWSSAGYPRWTVLTLVAHDDAGHVTSTAWAVDVDNSGPAAVVASPVASARVRGRVAVSVKASDPRGVTRVDLLVGGAVVASDSVAPFVPVWDSAGRNGPVELVVQARDSLGNVSTTRRTVVADHGAPSVRIASAPAGGKRVSGIVTIKIAAGDTYGVSRVELLVNGAVVRRDTSAPYSFRLNTGRWKRAMKIKVRAYDRAGNVSQTATRTWRRG
jgi:subtilisin family serine protease